LRSVRPIAVAVCSPLARAAIRSLRSFAPSFSSATLTPQTVPRWPVLLAARSSAKPMPGPPVASGAVLAITVAGVSSQACGAASTAVCAQRQQGVDLGNGQPDVNFAPRGAAGVVLLVSPHQSSSGW